MRPGGKSWGGVLLDGKGVEGHPGGAVKAVREKSSYYTDSSVNYYREAQEAEGWNQSLGFVSMVRR